MLWKLLQISVFSAVLFSNVAWQWTPNGYAAALVALMATIFATALVSEVLTRLGLYLPASLGHQRVDDRRLPRV